MVRKSGENSRANGRPSDDPIRVAIVGGGCAGLAAAWNLTDCNASSDKPRYEVTVYEESWALGGKGASYRDAHGRILEHGLHVWMGFYENAFLMMRGCFEELAKRGEAGKYDSFEKAFFAESHLGAAFKDKTGACYAWTGNFPPARGEPGKTPIDADSNPFTLGSYVARMLDMLKTLIHSVIAPPTGEVWQDSRAKWGYAAASHGGASGIQARPDARSTLDSELGTIPADDPSASADVLFERLARLVRLGALTTGAGLMQALAIFETALQNESAMASRQLAIISIVEAIVKHTRRLLADFLEIDESVRRRTEIIDLVMTIVVGLFRDKVMFASNGLDSIDDMDCREWLIKHGATYGAANSPFVRGLYDLAFAYRGGDKRFPSLAAGQGLRGALRMFFTYRGAIVWRMRAGMGDIVFSPLYRALLARNVKFKFNHRLAKASFALNQPEGSANRVTRLTFKYDHVEKYPDATWPALNDDRFWPDSATHRFSKLRQARTLTLEADRRSNGFDVVVFALGKDDFVGTCSELCDELDHYRQMREHVETVATQAVQFWFKADFPELGWTRGPVVMTGLDSPLDSWADMTHTLAAEGVKSYAAGKQPAAVAYLCGVLPDSGDVNVVKKNARDFLEAQRALDKLVSPVGGAGGAFEQQHFRANKTGSQRYTLSLPGTLKHRVSPLDGSVVNMTIAGDWTDCGFNEGCVEAAVMSGRLAAHAITGDQPPLDEIIGYNHP